jgi:hypothetical protein
MIAKIKMSDFNLYLYLGSYWVNTSRDTRLDTILDTGYKVRTRTKESRSIDRAENWEQSWTERSLDTKVELNPDVWEPGLVLKPESLIEERSVRGRISSSSTNTKEPGSVCNRVSLFVTYGPDFSVNYFMSDNR